MNTTRVQFSLNVRQPAKGPVSLLAASAVCALKLALALILLGQLVEMGELRRNLNSNQLQPTSSVATAKMAAALDNDTELGDVWGLINWTTYTKTFNKNYSSLQQQLARHKLFLVNMMKVFIAFSKFKFKKIGYFLVINRFSDMTPHEQHRLLSGNLDEPEASLDDDAIEDDNQIEQILRQDLEEALESENNLDNHQPDQSLGKIRLRRDLAGRIQNHYSAPMRIPPTRGLLDLADLVRVPNKNDELEQKQLKIKWLVPAENPFYVPVEHYTRGTGDDWQRPIEDIPKAEIEQIEHDSGSWLSAGLAGVSSLANTLSTSEHVVRVTRNLSNNRKELSDTNSKPIQVADAAKVDGDQSDSLTVVYKDWRDTGCVAPPYDQGYCNSCYAISATSWLEWAFCMNQERVLTPLSAQYLVSCGPQFKREINPKLKVDLYGCKKGRSRQAMLFVKEYGVELAVNMPYEADETVCPIDPNTPTKYKGYIRPNVKQHIRMAAATKQLELALKKGPVIVNFREPIDFMTLGGGMVENCLQRGGHAMLIVGYGVEGGTHYLLIKNSFGTDWGERGYFKFNRKYTQECIKDFILPRVTFPSKKSQFRRIKAYDASKLKTDDNNVEIGDFEIHMDKLA